MKITDNLKKDKYVAFLDVLGFKNLVKEKGDRLNKYFNTIEEVLKDVNRDVIDAQLISDSTILACNINNNDFRILLSIVQKIQTECAIQNIWIRGAITIGDIYFNTSPNIVVGNGLIRAYLLESQEKYPRVIIDPQIIKYQIEKNQIKIKDDFINEINNPGKIDQNIIIPLIHKDFYMDMGLAFENNIDDYSIFVAFAEKLFYENISNCDVIANKMRNVMYDDQKNYNKYLWLKNYFIKSINLSTSIFSSYIETNELDWNKNNNYFDLIEEKLNLFNSL